MLVKVIEISHESRYMRVVQRRSWMLFTCCWERLVEVAQFQTRARPTTHRSHHSTLITPARSSPPLSRF